MLTHTHTPVFCFHEGPVTLIILAIVMTSLSAFSGILAIGSGRHWNFTVGDYFRGKRNAILYLWVVSSSIFSICHSGTIIEYGANHQWAYAMPGDGKWMAIHSIVGLLLTFAHMFVASTLSKEVGPVDKYLWGSRRAVS